MDIGFIGVGNMGAGMANNLIKAGHTLIVHDLRRDAAGPLLEQGAIWAETPKHAAVQSQMIFTSLPGPPEVEAVALSEAGILEGLSPGSVYIDLSTNAPALVRQMHAIFQERGVYMLDAPVSGGVVGARTGLLAVMVGGDEAIYHRVKPVLDAIGDNVIYCGGIGAGCICKLVHNCIFAITSQAITELFTLGVKAGVDVKALWETTRRGAFGRDAGGIHRLPESWFSGDFEPNWEKGFFSTQLMRKDVGLATQLAREFNVPMALANMTEQELVEAINRGWGGDPTAKVSLLQEERAGVQVRDDMPLGTTRLVIEE
ncbi:2-hydroxy-3-oxopropionate reductase [Candidatus Entotheonellaceae bacterium PAL068K]